MISYHGCLTLLVARARRDGTLANQVCKDEGPLTLERWHMASRNTGAGSTT